MTNASSSQAKNEGITYAFYSESGDTNDNRIKHQIRWHDGASTSATIVTDTKTGYKTESYAGYNSKNAKHGGVSWLSSPDSYLRNGCAWSITNEGAYEFMKIIYANVFSVVPIFCINNR